jgi:hypothetical protein
MRRGNKKVRSKRDLEREIGSERDVRYTGRRRVLRLTSRRADRRTLPLATTNRRASRALYLWQEEDEVSCS